MKRGTGKAEEPKGQKLTPVAEVAKLPADLVELVIKILEKGGALEDAVEAVGKLGGFLITTAAVRIFFHERPELAERRMAYLLESAQLLRAKAKNPYSKTAKALPEPLELDLTNAWLLTGMMFLNRDDVRYTLRDAMRVKFQTENIALKREIFRRDLEQEGRRSEAQESRRAQESQRTELLRLKVAELREKALRPGPKSREELLAQVHEIYGLVAPDEPENAMQSAELES